MLQDRIYVVANDGEEENLLEEGNAKDNLLEMMQLWQRIESTGIVVFGFQIKFSDICYKPRISSPCKVSRWIPFFSSFLLCGFILENQWYWSSDGAT